MLTPSEHKTLASLAPTREVYGKPPLPIEILAAGGPKLLQKWLARRPDADGARANSECNCLYFVDGLGDPTGRVLRDRCPVHAREWLRKGKA